ncbi:MAG TPA: FHA domain-containing protein [Chloroflexota bacterium]|nr:FHA domain-containing protein [Chloroflexota bacterium]
MITCTQCGAQNLPGLAYCENCGSPLPQQAAPAAPAATAAPPAGAPADQAAAQSVDQAASQPTAAAAAPADQTAAQPVGQAAARPESGANLVAADGAQPAPSAIDATGAIGPTPPAPPTPQPAPAATAGATLSITFPSGQVFTMQGEAIDIGRTDVAQDWHPALDVIPYGGGSPELGVSRHQARITRQNGDFLVTDVGSTNGTYVNGRAVPYNQPVPLHNGDTLSFGALNTQVSIQ